MENFNKKDYKVEYTKGTGAGGQHKNKVETCVTITHIPTGFKERCQDTRYKRKNHDIAFERLKKRVIKLYETELHLEKNRKRIESMKNGVIRTYNYARNEVKDHRTGEKYNLKKFLNGDLDFLI